MQEIAYLDAPSRSLRMVQIGDTYAVQTLRYWTEDNKTWRTLYQDKTREQAVRLLESYGTPRGVR